MPTSASVGRLRGNVSSRFGSATSTSAEEAETGPLVTRRSAYYAGLFLVFFVCFWPLLGLGLCCWYKLGTAFPLIICLVWVLYFGVLGLSFEGLSD